MQRGRGGGGGEGKGGGGEGRGRGRGRERGGGGGLRLCWRIQGSNKGPKFRDHGNYPKNFGAGIEYSVLTPCSEVRIVPKNF